MAGPLRIGIIGCGGIARPHIRGWAAAGSAARIVAGSDVDPRQLEWLRSQVPGAATYEAYEGLLADAAVDAVDICLTHHLHRKAIVAAGRTVAL